MSFAEATAVVRVNESDYTGQIQPGWDMFGISNGGYIMCIAARAMAHEAQERDLVSITGYFTNPGRPGPVTVEVKPVKAGKGFSTFRAEVTSNNRPLLTVTAVYAKPDRKISETKLVEPAPLDLPPLEECVPAVPAADGAFPPPFVDKTRTMIHPDDAAALIGRRTGPAQVRGWFQLKEGEQPDPLALVLASDAFPPAVFTTQLPIKWTPTVELTVHIRKTHPSGWLKCHFRTRFVTEGFLEEDGEIWDENDDLVAQSRQLALVP